MKIIIICALVIIGIFCSARPTVLSQNLRGTTGVTKPASGFAVVELFTSEGCSSCPSADELLASLASEKRDHVFLLSFHVDYWNRLGWKDRFSDAAFSRRQQQYAATLGLSSVYTPQAVINGRQEVLGSDRNKMEACIESSLNGAVSEPISLVATAGSSKSVNVSYGFGQTDDNILCITLVELAAQTKVMAGENAGRLLQHRQIVRDLQIIQPGASGQGQVIMHIPAGSEASGFEVIAFTQRRSNLQITGCSRALIR